MSLQYVGTISRAFGVNGAVCLSDVAPGFECFLPGSAVCIGYSAGFCKEYAIVECTQSPAGIIVQLAGIETPENAAQLAEQGIFAEEALIKQQSGREYLPHEIIGCSAFDAQTGRRLGEIIDVWLLPANDVWVLEMGDKETPLPVIDDVIISVDIKARRINVSLMPGLLEIAHDRSDRNTDE